MTQILFKDETDISGTWLFYIENEARSLIQNAENDINNFMDREILNPELQDFLDDIQSQSWLSEEEHDSNLNLNYMEGLVAKNLPNRFIPKFKRVKSKVRKIFCRVVRDIEGVEVKDIIKSTITAIIASTGFGIPAVLIPIIIGLIALLLKYGVDAVCPI